MNANDFGKEPIEEGLSRKKIDISSSDDKIDRKIINDLEHCTEGLSSMTSTNNSLPIKRSCTETNNDVAMDINELSLDIKPKTNTNRNDEMKDEDDHNNLPTNESEEYVHEEKTSIESSHIEAPKEIQDSSNGLMKSNESDDFTFDSDLASSPLMYPDTRSSLEPKEIEDVYDHGDINSLPKNAENLTSFVQNEREIFHTHQVKHAEFESSAEMGESPEYKKEDFDDLGAGYGKGCPLFFLALPNDSMHAIASFLLPSDLVSLSCASKIARLACQPIFTTVRMHGFRCAIEIVSTWVSRLILFYPKIVQ